MQERHCEELATKQSPTTKNRLPRYATLAMTIDDGYNVRAEHFLPGCCLTTDHCHPNI
ncbi:MAG: hypothetical protein ACK5IQ_03085 [Bacteroidales bacterium]